MSPLAILLTVTLLACVYVLIVRQIDRPSSRWAALAGWLVGAK